MRKPRYKRLADVAVDLALEWSVISDGWEENDDHSPSPILHYELYGNLSVLEHLVHEMAHAASLGLDLGRGLSNLIGLRLSSLTHDRQCEEEATALVAGFMAWRLMRVPVPLDDDELRAAADIQGVTPPQLAGAQSSPETRAIAKRIVETLFAALHALDVAKGHGC